MKIPSIRQTGVSGAEQISLGAIASAGQAKAGQSRALTNIVNTYQDKIIKAETNEEYNRTTNNLNRDSAQLWGDIQGQDRVDENGASTHGAMLGQFNDGFKKLQEKHLGTLKYSSNKGSFSSAANNTFTSYSSTINTEVGRRRVSHLQGQLAESMITYESSGTGLTDARKALDEAMASGVVDSTYAAKTWDTFQHDYQSNALMTQFQSEREMGLNEEGESRGQVFLDNIAFPDTFDESDQRRITSTMTSLLNNDRILAEREIADQVRAEKEVQLTLTNSARDAKRLLSSGEKVSEEALLGINDTISQLTDPNAVKEMESALAVYGNIQSLMNMTMAEREDAVNNLPYEVGDNETADLSASTRRAYSSISKAIGKDPTQAYLMYGGGEPLEKITMDNLAESLVKTQANQVKVSVWLGDGIEAPPMSLAQINQIKALGVTAVDEVMSAYGKDGSPAVLNLLYKEDAAEMAIAGSLALQSDGESSYNRYLMGAKILSEDEDNKISTAFGSQGTSASFLFHEQTQGIFSYNSSAENTKAVKGMREVANTIYIGLASEAGMAAADPTIDPDLYAKAVTLAVGNIGEYNGQRVLMPDRDTTPDQLSDMIENLTMDQIDEMGGFSALAAPNPYGPTVTVSPEDVLERIRGGDAQLKQSDDFGTYQLWYRNLPVTNAAGEPFILDLRDK